MNGPEHYRRAESLLEDCQIPAFGEPHPTPETYDDSPKVIPALLAAIAHSNLAVAAATVDGAAHPGQSQVDYLGQWFRVFA